MALIPSQRRWLFVGLIALLCVPGLAMLFGPYQNISRAENRKLADPPSWSAGLHQLPRAVDAYLADHFGLREWMVRAGARITRNVGGRVDRPMAVEGRDGWMVLTYGLFTALGQEFDQPRAERYGDFVCELSGRLRAEGAKVVFASPPTSVSIYPEAAPASAGESKRPTEYEVIVQRARDCGVPTADLKRTLTAARALGRPLYRKTDTHWTPLGQVIAFDEIAGLFGRPDWRIDPASLKWVAAPNDTGDLPRLAGLPPRREMVEEAPELALSIPVRQSQIAGLSFSRPEFAPTLYETGRPGPTVLIVGDSFTQHTFPSLVLRRAGRLAWVHHEQCGFDWRVVRQIKPDYVLLATTERDLDCKARPKFF
ncbi:MAG TPA: hypothetical protein VIO94_01445 [Phenylobacterium sp.]